MGGRGRGRARATECANESEIVGGGGTARDSGPAPAQNSSQTIYIFWGSFGFRRSESTDTAEHVQ